MDKQNVYICHEIPLSHKKKWCTDTWYDMDEPRKWKKLDTRGDVLYNFMYMKYPKIGKTKLSGQKARLGIVKGQGKGVIENNCLAVVYEIVLEKFV